MRYSVDVFDREHWANFSVINLSPVISNKFNEKNENVYLTLEFTAAFVFTASLVTQEPDML